MQTVRLGLVVSPGLRLVQITMLMLMQLLVQALAQTLTLVRT